MKLKEKTEKQAPTPTRARAQRRRGAGTARLPRQLRQPEPTGPEESARFAPERESHESQDTEVLNTVPADPGEMSNLQLYLREIGQVKLLSPQDEIILAKRIQKGDEQAREHMIKANLRLVVKIAREYENLGLPLLDLINEGNMGLMKGVERFDPNKGAKLSTYAAWWIKQAIKRALANQSKTIRLPVHVVDKVAHIRRAELKLKEALDREPTDEELAADVGLKPRQLREYREAARAPVSLDAPLGDEDDSERVSEVVPDVRAAAPFEHLAKSSDTALVQELFATLSARERDVLNLRFGLEDDSPKTLEEIGQQYGLTRERIRQIESEGLKKLRTRIARRDSLAAESIMSLAE